MAAQEIKVKTFTDYTPTVTYEGAEYRNAFYPDYTWYADDNRNSLVKPRSIIIHSMCVPAEKSTTGEISTDAYACKNLLEAGGVSAHYLLPIDEVEEENGVEKKLSCIRWSKMIARPITLEKVDSQICKPMRHHLVSIAMV